MGLQTHAGATYGCLQAQAWVRTWWPKPNPCLWGGFHGRNHMITWSIINHVWLISDVPLHHPPHPGSHGPLSANENDTLSTTTPALTSFWVMWQTRRHPHFHIFTTHQLVWPQLAPPLIEGCGLATSSPKCPASALPWMAPNEKDTGIAQTKDAGRTWGKWTRQSPPPRSFFFIHNGLLTTW